MPRSRKTHIQRQGKHDAARLRDYVQLAVIDPRTLAALRGEPQNGGAQASGPQRGRKKPEAERRKPVR